MSCSWSLPTRRLATKTSKLEKKEVPGAANTTPRKPRGNSSTVGLLTAGGSEEASIGRGSIGSKIFLAPELPAPSTDEGGDTIGEPSPDPKRPRAPERPAPSTDGGGGTTSEPAPESEANLVLPAGTPEPWTEGGGGTICEPFPDNEPKRPRAPEWPAPSTDGGGGTTSDPESEPKLEPPVQPPCSYGPSIPARCPQEKSSGPTEG